MKYEITPQGWLIAGPARFNLNEVEHYRQQGGMVVVQTSSWGANIDCDPAPDSLAAAMREAKGETKAISAAQEVARANLDVAKETAAAIVAAIDAWFAKA